MAFVGRNRKKGTGALGLAFEETVPVAGNADLARIVVQSPGFLSDSDSSENSTNKQKNCFVALCSSLGRKCASAAETCFGDGDWFFLTVLGMGMAFFSFAMDDCIEKIVFARTWLYGRAGTNVGLQYLAWTGPRLLLVLISVTICGYVAPQAIGSGLPEMRTILRGVVLREYLTFRTLVAKAVTLTLCLGSGIPIGKEGPFVHICSIMAILLLKLMASFRKSYENESVRTDMLAAACAVGVACTFGSPIGGVLFSIEVTSVYFAVRNYWRGFFAATCSAIIFRMTAVWFKFETSPVAFTQTVFATASPFQPEELFVYAAIGICCGFGGPLYVITHRNIVLFNRNNKYAKMVWSKSRFIYPTVIVLFISSVTFGPGSGQFVVSMLSPRKAISDLFSHVPWSIINDTSDNISTSQSLILERWMPQNVSIFVTLAAYAICNFFTSCLANTLPIPTGVFIPTFVVGAAFGRMIGELLYINCPNGLFGNSDVTIVAGSYAIVGAAAFTGSVTHTFSTSVIVFELTGQIVYILPVMIAVLISNLVAAFVQPSIFDSIIRMKNLPYLPAMLPIESKAHSILVKQFMTTAENVKYISMETTLGKVKEIITSLPRVKAFPFVDSSESMILLGSIPRAQLLQQLQASIGDEARRNEVRLLRNRANDERLVQTILEANQKRICESVWGTEAPKAKQSAPAAPKTTTEDQAQVENGENSKERTKSESTVPGPLVTNDLFFTRTLQRLVSTFHRKKKRAEEAHLEEDDMTNEERIQWEKTRLEAKLDFQHLHIDNAPIQLVERTSLYKAHSLFSLLSLERAYVTRVGRLEGVVGLSDIRRALEEKWIHVLLEPDAGTGKGTSEGLLDVTLQPIKTRKQAQRRGAKAGLESIDENSTEESVSHL